MVEFDATVPSMCRRRVTRLIGSLPQLQGAPIRIGFDSKASAHLKPFGGSVYAGALLRQRAIVLDRCLRGSLPEFDRIFIHEIFHFVWVRLSNKDRWNYEALVAREIRGRVPGEQGWSSQWRKEELRGTDRTARPRRWREYLCESFCDSAARLYSGIESHPEYSLPPRYSDLRREWFGDLVRAGPLRC